MDSVLVSLLYLFARKRPMEANLKTVDWAAEFWVKFNAAGWGAAISLFVYLAPFFYFLTGSGDNQYMTAKAFAVCGFIPAMIFGWVITFILTGRLLKSIK